MRNSNGYIKWGVHMQAQGYMAKRVWNSHPRNWKFSLIKLGNNLLYWYSTTKVNFSPMSPKLLLTYPHRERRPGNAMASLFLRLILLKGLPNQLKIFVNLTFSPKVWPFCLFWFTLSWAKSALSPSEKKWHFGFVVSKMSIFKSLLFVIKEVYFKIQCIFYD